MVLALASGVCSPACALLRSALARARSREAGVRKVSVAFTLDTGQWNGSAAKLLILSAGLILSRYICSSLNWFSGLHSSRISNLKLSNPYFVTERWNFMFVP